MTSPPENYSTDASFTSPPSSSSSHIKKKVHFRDSITGWYGDLASVKVVESYKHHNKIKSAEIECVCRVQ